MDLTGLDNTKNRLVAFDVCELSQGVIFYKSYFSFYVFISSHSVRGWIGWQASGGVLRSPLVWVGWGRQGPAARIRGHGWLCEVQEG